VITGFNTDIPFEGVTYHVQTEDKGIDTPLILSLVYVGGAIIASKRTPYEDLLSSGFDEKVLTERLQRQHKLICAAIKAGRVDDLKRMGAAGANGETTAETEGARAAEGKAKAAGSRRKKTAAAQPRVEPSAAVEDKAGEEKAEEVKAAKGKAAERKVDEDKVVEEKTVEEKATEGERSFVEEPPAVEESNVSPVSDLVGRTGADGDVAPLAFGADFLTNLVDEISAMGEAQERATSAESHAPVQEPEAQEDDESPFVIVPAPAEPEVLLVEPLPFAFQGAPAAIEPEPPEELYLSLLDDEGDFRAGQLATIKVHVGRGAYGRSSVSGASVTVKVLGTTFRPLILTTDTDERGLAIIRALLPRFHSGRAALIIRATSGEEFSELRRIIHQ
jgi:hypothetical protein